MATFIFNWAEAALVATTLDLSTGSYYAHLVTANPLPTHTTVADLTVPTSLGYTSTALTGLSYNASRWTFSNFSFPKYVFASIPVGVVFCKKLGASPASSDPIICFSSFYNAAQQNITLTVGTYFVNIALGVGGAIAFSYRYQYSSGVYVNSGPVPEGLIYLVGTRNNTVAYSNPLTGATSISNASGATTEFTDRSIGTVGLFSTGYAFDFGTILIRPGTFGFCHRDTVSKTAELWGTKTLPAFTAPNIANNGLWTLLGTVTNLITDWNFITVSNTDYWRYFKLCSSDNTATLSLQEIEFYSSSALSPTANFV
jgi:hypothetical protein